MHSLESVQKYEDEVQIIFVGILTLYITKALSIGEKLEWSGKTAAPYRCKFFRQREFKKYTFYEAFLNLCGTLSGHRITEFTI